MSFWEKFLQNRASLVGLILVGIFIFFLLFAGVLSPYDASTVQEGAYKVPPAWTAEGTRAHLLGTDDLGRDFATRIIYGARVSLWIGFAVVLISGFIGIALGLWAGFSGGIVDTVVMRITDVLMTLPSVILAIVIVTVLGQSLLNAILAAAITSLPSFIRIVRASAMVEKNKLYAVAERTVGIKGFRQAVTSILPNCMAPVTVQAALSFSDGILSVAALGFLGLGAKPPTPEWGTMLSDARSFIESAPYLVTFPGLCILLLVLGFNLVGDGLRDALDTKMQRRSA